MEGIESKLISVFLINDIFVYGRAEFSSISLECTKVKLIILNNFDCNIGKITNLVAQIKFIPTVKTTLLYRGNLIKFFGIAETWLHTI